MNAETSINNRESVRAEKMQDRPAVAPFVDIFENRDELRVMADLPGVRREQLTIHFDKGQLTIEARRETAAEGNLLAAEYRPLDYRRTFLLPRGIDTDNISAELKQGVLSVHLPKSAAMKPRQIAVKAAE